MDQHRVEAGALVHLVEMRDRRGLDGLRLPSAPATSGRVAVVQHPLDQVASRQQILQPLLILDADGLAAELLGHAHGSHVHPALVEHLRLGQVGRVVAAEVEGQPLGAISS